jgi:hypothetical protein
MYRILLTASVAAAAFSPATALGQSTPVTTIVNPGFETGAPGTAVSTGWTQIAGLGPMFLDTAGGVGDVATAHSGSNYLTANRQVPEPDYPTSQNMGVMQDVDLSPYASLISLGGRQLELSFAYNDNDPNDTAVVSYSFLNSVGSPIGNTYNFTAPAAGTGPWTVGSLVGEIPIGASSMRLSLQATYNNIGTVRNVSYDTITANILPPASPTGRINGNLIQFNSDGTWSWYMDERLVQDPVNFNYLISSITSSNSTGNPGGVVRVTSFDPATGRRSTVAMSDLDEDDHNAGGLLVLPDGRYLTLYSNHGHQGLQDTLSRYRVTTNPHDASSWEPERAFDWRTTPGWNQPPFQSTGVSYHNVYYLPAEDRVINFSRGTHMAMGALEYDPVTDSLTWLGQTQRSITTNYGQGYYKYASNGVDKIYFIATETHPYDVNTSIYAGYYSNGRMFKMDGTVMDTNTFDSLESAPGATVPYTEHFTLVQQADAGGAGYNNLWTADLAAHPDGTLGGLYTSKFETNDFDQRLHYAYWDGSQWHTNEVAKMGAFLFVGQEEYTGVGAVVPNQPGVIYISTPINPATDVETDKYEIYKGVTTNGGADWTWTAVTENSSVDNLRPIATSGANGETVVSWFRGTYTAIWDVNAAVVGIIDGPDEQVGLVNYLDANSSNTMYASGGALQTSPPSGNDGPTDNLWHQRTGFGNGGSVLSSSENGVENAPKLKTTVDGLEDGTYDVFAYFWSDNDEDWRLMAGVDSNNLIDFRHYGSQFADADQFASIETVSASDNDLLLFRAYVGRSVVVGGAAIDVFIDDWQSLSGGAIRTWYDGVGYALVSETSPLLVGDYNDDGAVDAADYVVWRKNVGLTVALPNRDTANSGPITEDDFDSWRENFGNTHPGSGSAESLSTPEPSSFVLALLVVFMAMGRSNLHGRE